MPAPSVRTGSARLRPDWPQVAEEPDEQAPAAPSLARSASLLRLALPVAAPRNQPLLCTSAIGSLQAFPPNVSPHGDHRLGLIEDRTDGSCRGPSKLSWVLLGGHEAAMWRRENEKRPLPRSGRGLF